MTQITCEGKLFENLFAAASGMKSLSEPAAALHLFRGHRAENARLDWWEVRSAKLGHPVLPASLHQIPYLGVQKLTRSGFNGVSERDF